MGDFSRPKLALALLQAAFLLLLGACALQTTTPTPAARSTISVSDTPQASQESPSPNTSPTIAASPTPADLAVDSLEKSLNPLTGLPVQDESLLDRRPVAVKITLYPRSSRPQWGLSLADIVYEYYHNNNLTRFHAIFYGQDAHQAGPIRSARLPDEHLMEAYDSVLSFASADSRIRDALNDRYPAWRLASILEGVCPPNPVCRFDPEGFNHLLVNTARLSEYIEAIGGDNALRDLAGMEFAEEKPKALYEVERIYTWYSASAFNYWEYDADERVYTRYQDSWDAVGGRGVSYLRLQDRLTSQAVTADNVILLYMDHFHTVYVPAGGGRPATEVVDIDFEGGGAAYAFRDGLAYELQWKRASGEVLTLEYADGTPYAFKPGNTWFQVVNDTSRLDQEGDSWYFWFEFRP